MKHKEVVPFLEGKIKTLTINKEYASCQDCVQKDIDDLKGVLGYIKHLEKRLEKESSNFVRQINRLLNYEIDNQKLRSQVQILKNEKNYLEKLTRGLRTIRKIRSYDELTKIEDEKAESAGGLDLWAMYKIVPVIDGYILLIGAACGSELEMFFVDHEFFDNHKKHFDYLYCK